MEDLSKEILTDIEREKVAKFCEDPMLFEAVKKYVLAVCYKQGVIEKGQPHNARINWAMNLAWGAVNPNGIPRSDEELGQALRAMTSAVQMVESGFKELADMSKKVELLDDKENNPAE